MNFEIFDRLKMSCPRIPLTTFFSSIFGKLLNSRYIRIFDFWRFGRFKIIFKLWETEKCVKHVEKYEIWPSQKSHEKCGYERFDMPPKFSIQDNIICKESVCCTLFHPNKIPIRAHKLRYNLQFLVFPGNWLRLPKPRAVIISVLRNGARMERGILAALDDTTAAKERAGPASMHVWQMMATIIATNNSTR